MTRKKFKELMTTFIQLQKDEINLNKAFQKFDPDFSYFNCSRYANLFLDCIQEAMGDKENDWISYWIWELNFGEKAKDGTVKNKDGTSIPIKTLDDLYNILK